jgi:hypothetical protein
MMLANLVFRVRSMCSDFKRGFRKVVKFFVSMRCRITFDSQSKSLTCFGRVKWSCSFVMVALR